MESERVNTEQRRESKHNIWYDLKIIRIMFEYVVNVLQSELIILLVKKVQTVNGNKNIWEIWTQ